jgi:hypothetical protein
MAITNLNEHICYKILSDDDYHHYIDVLSNSQVKFRHPNVLALYKDDKSSKNFLVMERKGVPLHECSNYIINNAKTLIHSYLDDLHTDNKYHGDLVRDGGCGVNLGNVLYDEFEDFYYIIDFNTKGSLQDEKHLRSVSEGYCPNVLIKSKKKNESSNLCSGEHSPSNRVLFL